MQKTILLFYSKFTLLTLLLFKGDYMYIANVLITFRKTYEK